MNSPRTFVRLPPSTVSLGPLPRIFLAGVLAALLPACQGLGSARETRAGRLEQARQAWQAMRRESPGTLSAQNALWRYNDAVAAVVKSLRAKEGTSAWGKPVLLPGTRPWRLTFDEPERPPSARTFVLSDFAHCRLASDIRLHGFDRVVANGGTGVPVVLEDSRNVARPFHLPQGEFLPATAVLEFPEAVPGHPAEARLRFYNPMEVPDLPVGRHPRPLAANLTAPLEWTLSDAPVEKDRPHEVAPSASGEKESQLYFLNRYDNTKVPVVFVPGMLTKPSAWKNSVNELLADPDLRRRYQPVIFVYPPKLPIPVSAARLRELLRRSRARLDPGHQNAGFGRIVLVGHSMGGLVARMQVMDSGADFWYSFFTATPKKIASQLDDQTQRMMRESLFFRREPDVKVVVFIGTPHRGSLLADVSLYRAAMRMAVSLPEAARNRLHPLVELPPAYIQPTLRPFHDFGVEGVENLSTKHPFFGALALHPVRVPFHSIISVRHPGDLSEGSDDVVPYWSAHLDGSASETIVPYPHGCMERPETVRAVMKVLKEAR